jgi:hypothetical protein
VRIYIAGKFEEHSTIAKYAERLCAAGHEITFPWFLRHLGTTPLDQAAQEDLAGVRAADPCIFIFERPLAYAGSFAELGMAIALDKRVILVGDEGDRCVFAHLPQVTHVANFDKCMELLERWGR